MKPDAHKLKASKKWKASHGIPTTKKVPQAQETRQVEEQDAFVRRRRIVDNSFRFDQEVTNDENEEPIPDREKYQYDDELLLINPESRFISEETSFRFAEERIAMDESDHPLLAFPDHPAYKRTFGLDPEKLNAVLLSDLRQRIQSLDVDEDRSDSSLDGEAMEHSKCSLYPKHTISKSLHSIFEEKRIPESLKKMIQLKIDTILTSNTMTTADSVSRESQAQTSVKSKNVSQNKSIKPSNSVPTTAAPVSLAPQTSIPIKSPSMTESPSIPNEAVASSQALSNSAFAQPLSNSHTKVEDELDELLNMAPAKPSRSALTSGTTFDPPLTSKPDENIEDWLEDILS